MMNIKKRKKEKVGFSLDKELIDKLDQHCDMHAINKSKLINMLIKKYLESNFQKINSIDG